ncbi:MAG: hypothetical protein ACK41E_12110 [Deinococcales bacterium]
MSITRDTRPVDPAQQAQREKLDALSLELRQLHSMLLELVKADFEKLNGKTKGPFHMFQLVTSNPFFAWLRPLSGMMANIDELTDEKRLLNASELERIQNMVNSLLAVDEPNFGSNLETRARERAEVYAKRQAVLQLANAL